MNAALRHAAGHGEPTDRQPLKPLDGCQTGRMLDDPGSRSVPRLPGLPGCSSLLVCHAPGPLRLPFQARRTIVYTVLYDRSSKELTMAQETTTSHDWREAGEAWGDRATD